MKKNSNITAHLEALISYGQTVLGLTYEDALYARNQLYYRYSITESVSEATKYDDFIEEILPELVKAGKELKLFLEGEEHNFEAYLLGTVTPCPNEVISRFNQLALHRDVQSSTDYLFELSKNNNYIRTKDIAKNLIWDAEGDKGDIIITVNLSKPEKDPKQILKEKESVQSSYPPCALCVENMGFYGNAKKPARQNLRIYPLFLNDEEWYFQYSPYQYYDQHCIVLKKEHSPMQITPETAIRLLDFVELFPHYFMGSNADLPIVGGSILSHDHFQGGSKVLPMFKADLKEEFTSESFSDVTFGIVNWYNSVVRLISYDKMSLIEAASKVLEFWRGYSDENVGIFANTTAPHNTLNPIARMENGKFVLDLILRNNRTDEKHPYGIFHPTEDMHNIKKEGIGLIEAMGTFILPGRLSAEATSIIDILTGKAALNFKEIADEKHPLSKHLPMIVQLVNDKGTALNEEDAGHAVTEYINKTCIKILKCTAVFKDNEEGEQAFSRFMKSMLENI